MSTAHARMARQRRARALEAVDARSLRGVINNVPEALQSVPVHVVLTACPGIGPVTCKGVLERAGVWPLAPLCELTAAEKQSILELLGKKAR